MNSVFLLGNLTDDPEIISVGENTVAKFSVAWNNPYVKDKESPKAVSFFNCEFWGKGAEVFTKFHKKGDKVCLTGSLIQDRWGDKETGKTRSAVKVKVDSFDFVTTKEGGSAPSSSPSGGNSNTAVKSVEEDDIPF